MIINDNNKNNILKGTVKRGFNQTPGELKEKLYNECNMPKQESKEEKKSPEETISPAQKLSKALNNIKRMQ
ncbi:MAG: hypothetical protein IKG27_03740 [Bacilli bacterium]|nr:hypothetical protein [Bacilli bacterium]